MPIAPLPSLDKLVHLSPAAQVEIADAEVCALCERERFAECRQQRSVDVVEDAGHDRALRSVSVLPPCSIICVISAVREKRRTRENHGFSSTTGIEPILVSVCGRC